MTLCVISFLVISGRSCIFQLLEYIEGLTEAIDNGEDMDVIYY